MEYSDFIRDIIALEHRAREMTRAAHEQEAAFNDNVAQKVARLREEYFARAERRLAQVAKAEADLAEETIAAQERQFDDTLRRVESAYDKNHKDWAQQLFSQIVESTV